MHSATTGLGLGSGRHSRTQRKKKTRVVNLRKPKTTDDIVSESGDSETASIVAASEPAMSSFVSEEPEDNIITPPHSPSQKVRFQSIDLGESPRKARTSTPARPAVNLNSRPVLEEATVETAPIHNRERRPSFPRSSFAPYPVDKKSTTPSTPLSYTPAPVITSDNTASRGIVEQAWLLKMAGEIARYANDEKAANGGFWSSSSTVGDREDSPPPAYQPKA
jgi:distribution and morphology protein 34